VRLIRLVVKVGRLQREKAEGKVGRLQNRLLQNRLQNLPSRTSQRIAKFKKLKGVLRMRMRQLGRC